MSWITYINISKKEIQLFQHIESINYGELLSSEILREIEGF